MASTRTRASDAPDTTEDDAPEETEEQKRTREDNEKEQARLDHERELAEKRGEEAMANAPDPENPDDQDKFSSLLTRDTTHFQNVHYGQHGPVDRIAATSSQQRVELIQHLMAAAGLQVNPGAGWDYATQKAAMELNEDGEITRAEWDKLSDIVFGKDDSPVGKGDKSSKEPKPASVPTGG